MQIPRITKLVRLACLGSVITLTACSSTPEVPQYLNEKTVDALSVPPDLHQPVPTEDYQVPALQGQQHTFSAYSGVAGEVKAQQLLPVLPKMSLERDGGMAWLSIADPADAVWSDLKSFIISLGFNIAKENANLGILETDWQLNHIERPRNWFVAKLGKLFGDNVMDQFQITLERSAKDKSLVFVTHRGLIETEQNGVKGWQPRPVDMELETEVLRRFMLFRGLNADAAQAQFISKSVEGISVLGKDRDGQPQLVVQENFARTWRRVGLAMDRLGFVVDDRNRSAGVYYIRLPENYSDEGSASWFSQLMAGKQKLPKEGMLIKLEEQNSVTAVRLSDRSNKPVDSDIAQKMLLRIKEQMY